MKKYREAYEFAFSDILDPLVMHVLMLRLHRVKPLINKPDK